MNMNQMLAVCAAGVLGCVLANAAQSQVRTNGPITTVTLASPTSQAGAAIDFANAKPMPLPAGRILPPSAADALRNALEPVELFGLSGASAGGPGDGEKNPLQLVAPQDIPQGSETEGVEPDEFGTSGQPYTTSEVNALGDLTVNHYPFRAAGKLFFKIGANTFVCSASLIKPGIVVTAAHCVANYGQRQFYSGWTYVPAYNNGSAPYGTWTARSATLLTAYYNGTDNCIPPYNAQCPDDVAVITENPQSGRYPGRATGWFGYGWNGYGFNGSSQAMISQLGYPVALDGGLLMERVDSQGFVTRTIANNTIIGSLMTGGSSGGPWLLNLGMAPSLSGVSFGSAAQHNTVVGVTSWGYTNSAIKQMGASPFTSKNVVLLVNAVCTANPSAC
jgi:hypothetical protein